MRVALLLSLLLLLLPLCGAASLPVSARQRCPQVCSKRQLRRLATCLCYVTAVGGFVLSNTNRDRALRVCRFRFGGRQTRFRFNCQRIGAISGSGDINHRNLKSRARRRRQCCPRA